MKTSGEDLESTAFVPMLCGGCIPCPIRPMDYHLVPILVWGDLSPWSDPLHPHLGEISGNIYTSSDL